MYQYIKLLNGQNDPGMIFRPSDGAYIPNNILNRDWVVFQAWLAAGNTPLAA